MKQAILFFILTVTLAACDKETAPPAKAEHPVLTHIVGTLAGDTGNVYSGEIRARHEAALSFRTGGKIIERLVDAGAAVKAGQVLARLDPADAGLQVSAAEAQYRLVEAEVKRYRELRGKGFASQSALDEKEAAFKAAAAQAGLARNQAAYTTLRADRAGVVAAILAEAGQVVGAGQPVLRVAQDGEREVAVAIPEQQLADLKIGAAAEVELLADGDAGAHLAGRLRELAPVADTASRTYPARIALSGADARVALGMTAQVRFKKNSEGSGLLVPLAAIFQQGDQAAVWVVAADHTVSLRPVQVTAYRDDGAVIAGGVVAGERIVSAGVHKLGAGEKIRVIGDSGKAR
ncbi:MAG: efflux RND transporter periplasmic adaptor subunit [Gallionella sp.]|nr:MAG: efflux RND transporter periplasmic adaptor subunit [Gallionella sp.]